MNIHIPNPCEAEWKQMTPAEDGRFCSTCSKVVVDFTSMNEEQLKSYFLQLSSQKVCGRFKQTQLTQGNTHYLLQWKERLSGWKATPWRLSALFLIGLAITVSGCENRDVVGKRQRIPEEEMTPGAPGMKEEPNEVTITGDTIYAAPRDTSAK